MPAQRLSAGLPRARSEAREATDPCRQVLAPCFVTDSSEIKAGSFPDPLLLFTFLPSLSEGLASKPGIRDGLGPLSSPDLSVQPLRWPLPTLTATAVVGQ